MGGWLRGAWGHVLSIRRYLLTCYVYAVAWVLLWRLYVLVESPGELLYGAPPQSGELFLGFVVFAAAPIMVPVQLVVATSLVVPPLSGPLWMCPASWLVFVGSLVAASKLVKAWDAKSRVRTHPPAGIGPEDNT